MLEARTIIARGNIVVKRLDVDGTNPAVPDIYINYIYAWVIATK